MSLERCRKKERREKPERRSQRANTKGRVARLSLAHDPVVGGMKTDSYKDVLRMYLLPFPLIIIIVRLHFLPTPSLLSVFLAFSPTNGSMKYRGWRPAPPVC